MCSMGQISPNNQKRVTLNTNSSDGPPSEEYIKTGYKLFQAMVFCPTMSIRLFRFVDQLVSRESPRTIIHTFVNLFRSGAITDKISFTLAKQFYLQLASTLNLQYGNVLLATSTNAQLQAAIRDDLPFFANNSDLVEKYLNESHFNGIQDIFKKLGNVMLFSCCCHSINFVTLHHIADVNGVSRELSLHPVHLTPDKDGNLPPSALVPFCSYQGDSNLLGQERPELDNLTICDKFKSTILEGQLCYSLNIAKLGKKLTKSGKKS